MSSILPGFEYDIFISYRHKDNKGDHWVTEFVTALKTELEATFKEDISIYFDENPHDGLLENHDVDDSLKEKLRCLIFIPIISQTYCDPKSFAWKNEFLAFKKTAVEDTFGLKVKLANGNVASRILPIRIHEIDVTDQKLLEDELQGKLRAIDFIYHSAGVNRPLTPKDERELNLNKIFYRDQINKVANSVKEIITGLQAPKNVTEAVATKNSQPKSAGPKKSKWVAFAALLSLALLAGWWLYNRASKPVISQSIKESRIAVLPFENKTNDAELDVLGDMAADFITNGLMDLEGIKVVTFQSAKENIKLASFGPEGESNPDFAKRTGAETIVMGRFYKNKDELISQVQIIDAITGEVLMVMPELKGEISDPYKLVNELKDRMLTAFAIRSASVSGILSSRSYPPKLEAYRSFNEAMRYYFSDKERVMSFLKKAVSEDSTFALAYIFIAFNYQYFNDFIRADSMIRQIDSRFPHLSTYESLVLDQLRVERQHKSLTLNPSGAEGQSGTLESVYQQAKKGYNKDPKDFFFNYHMLVYAYARNKPVEALSACRQIDISLFDFSNALQEAYVFEYALTLSRLNQLEESKRILRTVPIEKRNVGFLAYVISLQNNEDSLNAYMQDLEKHNIEKIKLANACRSISYRYALAKKNEEQKKWANRSLAYLKQSAPSDNAPWALAWSLYLSDQLPAALQEFDRLNRKEPKTYWLSNMGCIYAKLGQPDKAREMISKIQELDSDYLGVNERVGYKMARIYAALGEKEKAMNLIRQGWEETGYWLSFYYEDFEFIGLFDYPPFVEFMKPRG